MNTKNPSVNSLAACQSRGYFKVYNTIWSAILLMAIFISGCKKDDFEGEITGLCPVVTTDPVNDAKDVAVNKVITLTFNTVMKASTINATTVTLKQGATPVTGIVAPTADDKIFTFTPSADLLPYTVYTGTVSTGAQDTLKTAMAADYVWTFTTVPRVTLTSNPIDPAIGGTTSGAGDFAQGSTAIVTAVPSPGYAFTNWTKAGVIVSATSEYSFTMDGNVALVANFIPSISSFNVNISVFTNGILSPLGGTAIGAGAYSSGSGIAVRAIPNSGYNFTGWSEVGNPTVTTNPLPLIITANRTLVANFVSGGPITGPAVGPLLPNLGGAADFSILTKAGISTTGVTLINGNIGVSPAAATAITGFGLIMDASETFSRSPIVTGRIYASDYAAPTPSNTSVAISNMESAYTTANGLTTPSPVNETGAGNISGLTLAPGLYKWSTNVLIDPNTTVTLSGGVNDTWVFQIAQDLIVNNSARIVLSGGAQAKNIMWVVAGQATLGTQANFSGIILSKTLISLNNGTIVTGKLLAQTAVTLIGSTVIQP